MTLGQPIIDVHFQINMRMYICWRADDRSFVLLWFHVCRILPVAWDRYVEMSSPVKAVQLPEGIGSLRALERQLCEETGTQIRLRMQSGKKNRDPRFTMYCGVPEADTVFDAAVQLILGVAGAKLLLPRHQPSVWCSQDAPDEQFINCYEAMNQVVDTFWSDEVSDEAVNEGDLAPPSNSVQCTGQSVVSRLLAQFDETPDSEDEHLPRPSTALPSSSSDQPRGATSKAVPVAKPKPSMAATSKAAAMAATKARKSATAEPQEKRQRTDDSPPEPQVGCLSSKKYTYR